MAEIPLSQTPSYRAAGSVKGDILKPDGVKENNSVSQWGKHNFSKTLTRKPGGE